MTKNQPINLTKFKFKCDNKNVFNLSISIFFKMFNTSMQHHIYAYKVQNNLGILQYT